MQVITRDELNARPHFYTRELKKSIFIYPTDTIYGIGCDAFDGVMVEKIRELKGRADMPFSVIPPDMEWVREHCVVTEKGEEWLTKLPGPYTLILKMRKPEDFPESLTRGRDTLGVRFPDHWISCIVSSLKTPIVTTSANKTGANHMKNLDGIPSEWKGKVKYVLFDGELAGRPSTLVDLSQEEVEVIER